MKAHDTFEVLPGLPTYGPAALRFSDTGMGSHSEGFVVRFFPANGDVWTGNFCRGLSNFSTVIPHPNGSDLIVVAGGTAYVVDPLLRRISLTFGAQIEYAQCLPEIQAVIFCNGLWFELVNSNGHAWRSSRVSWDGIKDITVTDDCVIGKGWCFDDTWHDFQIKLASGVASGGAYSEPH